MPPSISEFEDGTDADVVVCGISSAMNEVSLSAALKVVVTLTVRVVSRLALSSRFRNRKAKPNRNVRAKLEPVTTKIERDQGRTVSAPRYAATK